MKFSLSRGHCYSFLSKNDILMEFRVTLGNPDFQMPISQALGKNSKFRHNVLLSPSGATFRAIYQLDWIKTVGGDRF